MKAEITVEQFDNGITLSWEGDFSPETEKIVVPEGGEKEAIGKMILEDINAFMDTELCNKVKVTIEYNKE